MKSSFVALVGRPSTGKSTLINTLCGRKVSIVSPVPQTTRNKIRGILNRKEGQLVLTDTPGFHQSGNKMGKQLRELIRSAIGEADLVVYLIDITRRIGEEEISLMRLLAARDERIIIACNKIDRQSAEAGSDEVKKRIRRSLAETGFRLKIDPLYLSALTGEGCDRLVDRLFEMAGEGEIHYPQEFYTDQDPHFRIAEIIREKAINRTYQEVPHALYTEISDSELKNGRLWVRAFLCVERDSQKGILIGRKGSKIRAVRMEAESELNRLFPYRVKLDLRVRTRPKWRRKDHILSSIL